LGLELEEEDEEEDMTEEDDREELFDLSEPELE